jgi:hypothetical protein
MICHRLAQFSSQELRNVWSEGYASRIEERGLAFQTKIKYLYVDGVISYLDYHRTHNKDVNIGFVVLP